MRLKPILSLFLFAVSFAGQSGFADVTVPNIFSNSMVLQRDQANAVWGKASPGEAVSVAIDSQKHSTTADEKGNWRVTLEPMKVGEPKELVISGKNEIRLTDVLVGEVWICSGQSNMQWAVRNSTDFALEAASANHPQIRMINFPQVGVQEPIWTHDDRKWMVCSPELVPNFSAVGYFFARQLHQTLGVPIGMINNAWGGSACEAWINRETLSSDEQFAPLIQRWQSMEKRFEELSVISQRDENQQKEFGNLKNQMSGNARPGNIYNGVLKSHLGYGIRGAIWYQGESNAGRAYQYRELFPLMISSWRKEWGQGDFPFYWVQLADFMEEKAEPSDSAWAELREAQTMTMAKLPNTGQAVIIDIGEGKDIHPRNKVTVGMRLARWALAKDYGMSIPCHSPQYKSMEVADNKVVLTFDHVGSGWRPFDVNQLRGFTIAGEDKKFVNANATLLKDGRIEVSSDAVANPVAVRYGWADNPICNLFSVDDLPLTPFRTDDWPGITANAN
jgi:sialate O-acetylesterase